MPRPPGVHQYLAHSMMGEKQLDRTEMWRGVEIVRGFFKDTEGLYQEVVSRFTAWKQSASETKDFRTASYFLRYDREGKMRMMTMRSAGYEKGMVPRLDALVSKIHQKVKITDPNHGAGMYWFSDGDASVGSHRHVFWSARVALGAERIMMVDKTPILMQEGDLVVIGPQRHGVPSMPDVSEGSLRISVPFRPQANGQWEEEASPEEAWEEPDELETLRSMGFEEAACRAALQFCGTLEAAVEALTNEDFEGMLQGDLEDVDASLARRLQMEELRGDASEELHEQFEEYEKMLEVEDAERAWDGYGDLMHNAVRRANLNLDMLGPQKLFSLGAASPTEKQFFELLSLHSIRVLYDFRPTDYRDEVRSQQPFYEIRSLKSKCKQRGIHYRHVAVGRESALGVLRHMESEEVQHILVELVWQAKHQGRSCFLGPEEDWRSDGRLAIAEVLVKHGHEVRHVRQDGGLEEHEAQEVLPDFLLQEEARLRKLQAQRKAGEVRIEKSVDRSTEAVARALATEKVSVDVAAELRGAENQDELARAQKRMVRLQVSASKAQEMGKKQLLAVPAHVVREAVMVRERLEARKEGKKAKAYGDDAGDGDLGASSSAAPAAAEPPAPRTEESDTHGRRWGERIQRRW